MFFFKAKQNYSSHTILTCPRPTYNFVKKHVIASRESKSLVSMSKKVTNPPTRWLRYVHIWTDGDFFISPVNNREFFNAAKLV